MSQFSHHEPCPQCGSRDNLARFDDGHAYCFGCRYYEPGDEDSGPPQKEKRMATDLIEGEARSLPKRGINETTARKFRYQVGTHKGRPVQIANYAGVDGRPGAGQKIRTKDKEFFWKGSPSDSEPLWGMSQWRDDGKIVVITEGEIDAMSVSQIQSNKWPVVSLKDGAHSAVKSISKAVDWLENFERVVFMFDQDEPGMDAAREAALCLSPGKARIAQLPLKDPNEMLLANRGREVVDAIWSAKPHRPDGLVSLGEIKEQTKQPLDVGLPWWGEKLTSLTYGRRAGEVYTLGAGTGVGKTDFLTQQAVYDLVELGEPVGMFFLEQQPVETAKRLAGKAAHRRFHVPDGSWTHDELDEALDSLDAQGQLYLYDHFGSCDWDIIQKRIRYLARSEGVRLFYLDHLTALVSGTDNERVELERVMSEIGSLVKELQITLHLVSHLSTPEGKPHEEGGRVMIRHFKGSRAIGYWSHYMIGLERDQQEVGSHTVLRVLKDRYTGQATGETIALEYDAEAGLMAEAKDNPFTDDEEQNDGSEPF